MNHLTGRRYRYLLYAVLLTAVQGTKDVTIFVESNRYGEFSSAVHRLTNHLDVNRILGIN